jgi:hypothetical protein
MHAHRLDLLIAVVAGLGFAGPGSAGRIHPGPAGLAPR